MMVCFCFVALVAPQPSLAHAGYKPLLAPTAVVPDATVASTAIVTPDDEPAKPGHINFFSDLEQGKVRPILLPLAPVDHANMPPLIVQARQ